MSFINSARDILRVGLREGTRYRAIVTDNKDPKQLARIRFKIPKFFDLAVSDSPWAICGNAGIDGSTSTTGSLDIPRIGSYVDVEFMNGSPYHPRYMSSTLFKPVQLEQAQINYPDRKIMRFSNGTYIVLDLYNNLIQVFNPGDVTLDISGTCGMKVDGALTISCNDNATVQVNKGNLQATVSEGDCNINADAGNVNVNSAKDITLRTTGGKIYLSGESGDDDLAGVVTGACTCAFTSRPHQEYSMEVFATTGGT